MTTKRKINFGFLEKQEFEIEECIKFQGWEYLCSLKLPTYPNLVREFYENASIGSKSLETEVKGVEIHLIVENLGQLLKTPMEGTEKFDDQQARLRLLFNRDDALDFEEILAKHLSMKHCLLHHMVCKVFIPWIGRFDYVIRNDVRICYHILKKEKFNFSTLMMKTMQEARMRAKSALPYGKFLTIILRV